MAGVCRLFMGLPVPPATPDLPHNFTYIPFVTVTEDQWPPLAGVRRPAEPAMSLVVVAATAPVTVGAAPAVATSIPGTLLNWRSKAEQEGEGGGSEVEGEGGGRVGLGVGKLERKGLQVQEVWGAGPGAGAGAVSSQLQLAMGSS